jgi:hypothetical protein
MRIQFQKPTKEITNIAIPISIHINIFEQGRWNFCINFLFFVIVIWFGETKNGNR